MHLDEERLSLALAAARLGDFRWDAKTDVMELSVRAQEIFGVPSGTPRPQIVARIHDDDRPRVTEVFESALRDRHDYSAEYRLAHGDRERWVCVSGRGVYEGSELVGVIGVVQDLTRDRFLARIDDAVRTLVLPEDITYTSAKLLGDHLGVNRCAYAFVEADEDTFTIVGNYANGANTIAGTHRFRWWGQACLDAMRAGLPWVVADAPNESRLTDKEKKAYPPAEAVGVICVPIRKNGHFVASMAVHTTSPRTWKFDEVELLQHVASRCWESIERARVEREREGLLDAAKAANRAKDEFLAMLGHELRNPLAPIRTALQLMKARGDEVAEKERIVIERQVEHLTRLVDDLLDVARIARGKVALDLKAVDVSHVIGRALEITRPLVEQRGHRLEVHAPKGLSVLGDPERLVQVFSNLFTNAAKYTPSGGRVSVHAEKTADKIIVRVKDNGVGMTPEVQRTAFDLFVQGRQSIDRAEGGLGLGLSIVRNLVERHDGSVAAFSEGPGRGSDFTVVLPWTDARMITPVPVQSEIVPADAVKGVRVLVVDDNEDAAELLGAALEMKGAAVTIAHDGARALELANESQFDAALLDIGLPLMDGYELAGKLRALPSAAKTVLVAVTGYGQESDKRRATAAGFHHHLVKPIDLGALERIVADVRSRG